MQLDGKPMKIEIVGTNIATHAVGPPAAVNPFENFNGVPRRYLSVYYISALILG